MLKNINILHVADRSCICARRFTGRASLSVNSGRVPRCFATRSRSKSANEATTVFRSARDLITDGEWAKAQEKFDEYVTSYPNEKNIERRALLARIHTTEVSEV